MKIVLTVLLAPMILGVYQAFVALLEWIAGHLPDSWLKSLLLRRI